MTARVTKEVLLSLIMLYREHENLYVESHADYNNHEKRKESIRTIHNRLSKIKPKLKFTFDQIEEKVTSLRNRYHQEADLIEKAKSQGIPYSPTLWCFEELRFLSKSKSGSSNKSKESQIDPPFDNLPTEEEIKRKVNVKFLENSAGFLRESHLKHALVENSVFTLGRHAENLELAKENRKRVRNFGNFVAAEMQKISDPTLRAEVKWDIQMALRKGIEKDMSAQS